MQRVAVITSRSTIARKKRGLDTRYARACVQGVTTPIGKNMSEIELIGLVSFALVTGFIVGRSSMEVAKNNGSILNRKLDAVIEHLGISFDPYKNIPSRITDELNSGNRIKAIKLYRQFSGEGLKEAKKAIDTIESHQ